MFAGQYNRFITLTNKLFVVDGKMFQDYVVWLGHQLDTRVCLRARAVPSSGSPGNRAALAKVFTVYKQVLLQEESDRKL